jgi:hypothetical protein
MTYLVDIYDADGGYLFICRRLQYFNVIIPNALLKRKFHSCFKHWINSILEYGSPFLYSGEANEEFHKVACKVQISMLYPADIYIYNFCLIVGIQAYQQAQP